MLKFYFVLLFCSLKAITVSADPSTDKRPIYLWRLDEYSHISQQNQLDFESDGGQIIKETDILCRLFYSQPFFLIKGFVYNAETGEPIAGANLMINESNQGTSSGIEGQFEIKLAAGNYRLTISALSYSLKEFVFQVPYRDQDQLIVEMIPEPMEIEGVEIVGMMILADRDSSVSREPISLLPSITRLSAVEIEKQGAVTLTDAFKYVPGGWTETRGRKTKQFFSVRGQKYPYPDYSINGIWQKEFEETGYFFSALDIESIEIVRSSSALVKGLSGLTGVVDVKTRKTVKETISLLAKYGEQNNYITNLHYGNKINDVAFNSSSTFFGSNGLPGRNGRERISNFNGNIDWTINKKMQLYVGATYIGGLRELVSIEEPGVSSIMNSREKFDPIRTLLSYAKLNYSGVDGSITEIQTNLAYRNHDYLNYNIIQQSDSEYKELDYEYGLNILHSRPLSSTNTLRIGILYNHWVAPEGKRYYVGRACNVHTWSGVIASEQKVGRFLFDGGIRLISGYIVEWGGFNIEGSSAGFQNVEPIEKQTPPLEWQSVLGASYIISNSASLHYNFAGGTIAPRRGSLNEQSLSPGNETRLQHDLGFRYKSHKNNELLISAFFNQRYNAIELSGNTITTGEGFLMELYENNDKRGFGLELTTKLNLPCLHSFLFANTTLMKMDKMTDDNFSTDEQTPGLIQNVGIQFDHSGFDVNLYCNYIGPYTNNRFVKMTWIAENGDFPLGDFVAMDITAGYTFKRRYSTRIFAEVKNLLDQNYLTVAGYPDPGRLFFSGIKINFK